MKISPFYIVTEHSTDFNKLYIQTASNNISAKRVAKKQLKKYKYGQSFILDKVSQVVKILRDNPNFGYVLVRR